MDLETVRTLLTPDGDALLAEAVRAYGTEDEFALGTRLRRDHPPDLVAAALTQARLRNRAVEKFGASDAARMLFTLDGYEQATRTSVATHRATRIAHSIGPRAHVADLCCGIGGDLVALARADVAVTGFDIDPATVAIANANVAAVGVSDRARATEADVTTVDRTAFAAVTCDPSRRTARGRTFDPDAYLPSWEFVTSLLSSTACVKVAPGIPRDRVPDGVEAEWVSERGQVKEAALWSGNFAADTRRRATLLPSGATLTDLDDPGTVDVAGPGRFVYEPDGAVIRAGLVTAVADIVGGWLLDPTIAYVASERYVPTHFARAFEVVQTLPYDVKALRRYVREHEIGTVTVKKRGVDVDPEKLRAAVRPRGEGSITLIVTRVSGRAAVLVAQPAQ